MLLSCPKCGNPARRAGFPFWVILVAIFLFPVGLLALLDGRKPTTCPKCGFAWQA